MEIFLNIVLYLLCTAIVIQLFYIFFFFFRLAFYKDKEQTFQEGVSVIICAKDESENIAKYLPSFLNQDYPFYEVIVVDDQSVDGSKYLLKDLEQKNISIPPTIFIEPKDNRTLKSVFDESGWNEAIVKPAISGAARHTYRLSAENISHYEEIYYKCFVIQSRCNLLYVMKDIKFR